jgi:glutathione S-transferase
VALLAAEKTVQFFYEFKLRPKEFSYAPWVARCAEQMHAAFRMLEAQPESPVLSGGKLTQADITIASVIRFAQHVLPAEFLSGRYPRLEKLSAHCETLPAFIDTPLE